jgi:pimeloyl-ACP methyl ester carboxylesterase
MSWMLLLPAALALEPKAEYTATPALPHEAATIQTNDGATLQAWWFPNPKATTRTVVFVSDGTGNMGDDLRRVETFLGLGYNVATFDYRGFGTSSAFAIDPGMYLYPHFQDDVSAAIGWASQRSGGPVDVHGWGIGAGLGLGIGWNRADVAGILADGPFQSMEALEKVFATYDTPPEVPFAGYDRRNEPLYSFDVAATTAPKAGKRVFLVTSDTDPVCRPEDLAVLKRKRPKNVLDVVVITNPGKVEAYAVDPAAYAAMAKRFAAAK